MYFYLWFNLKGEVGVQITQFHLVIKQYWVVTVLRCVSSLGEYAKQRSWKSRMLSQHKPPISWHMYTICSAVSSSNKQIWSPRGLQVCKCQRSNGDCLVKTQQPSGGQVKHGSERSGTSTEWQTWTVETCDVWKMWLCRDQAGLRLVLHGSDSWLEPQTHREKRELAYKRYSRRSFCQK